MSLTSLQALPCRYCGKANHREGHDSCAGCGAPLQFKAATIPSVVCADAGLAVARKRAKPLLPGSVLYIGD